MYRILLLSLLTLYSYPMLLEKSQEVQEETQLTQQLIIRNNTTWSLIVLYSSTNKEEVIGTTITPVGYVLLDNPSNLTSLEVLSSEKLWHKTQVRTPENVRDTINTLLEKDNNDHIEITVLPPQVEYVTPFKLELSTLSDTSVFEAIQVPTNNKLSEAFPNVLYAITQQTLPFPRRYLGISLQSPALKESLPSIEAAYIRLTNQWHLVRDTHTTYVDKVVEILTEAYQLLKTHCELSHKLTLHNLSKITPSLSLKEKLNHTEREHIIKLISMLSGKVTQEEKTNYFSEEKLTQAKETLISEWEEIKELLDKELYNQILSYIENECTFLIKRKDLETHLSKEDPTTLTNQEPTKARHSSTEQEAVLDYLLNQPTNTD